MRCFAKLRLLPVAALLLAGGSICPVPARAAVAIIASRVTKPVEFAIVGADGKAAKYRVKAFDTIPVEVTGQVKIAFPSSGVLRQYVVPPNSVHYFAARQGKLELLRIPLPPAEGEDPPPPPPENIQLKPLAIIPVMLLVDDNEPAVRRLWEQRLRQRLAHASTIFERYCRVRFEVAAVGTWVSDNRIGEFSDSLREFEMKVNPAPARVAIGFTSQYRLPRGQTHLGGTRGALHSHVLIREWSQHVTKSERLEVLVHELGHFLGATHSPEYHSVMRPTLGDRRSHARSFHIGFDPLNTMAMYLIGEELRSREVRRLWQLRPDTKAHLRSIYTELAKAQPEDEATPHFLQQLGRRTITIRPRPTEHPDSLVKATRAVVQSITRAAEENRAADPASSRPRLAGDRLTEFYVRRAAATAADLPPELAAKALLVGLGIALDDSSTLRYMPVLSGLIRQAETSEERRRRVAALGSPTMAGRRDLAQHFFLSCALTAMLDPQRAESIGIAKELNDARGRSGFSFVDLSADMAGVTFATVVGDSRISLARVANSFTVGNFLPDGKDLEEGLAWDDFLERYGSTQDDRFHRQRAAIRQRIQALPGYRKP